MARNSNVNTDNTNTDDAAVEAATVAAPRTLAEKIALTEALLAKYRAEELAEAIKADIREGDVVTFNFGRGDKKRSYTGAIVGIKNDEAQGLLLRVSVGEGFDVEVYKVHVRDLTSNVTQDERNATVVEEAPVEATDPLAAE